MELGNSGWYVIHAGIERGPFSLGELAEQAAVGKIDADDLVTQTGGLWTKARDVPSLQAHFSLGDTRKQAADHYSKQPSLAPIQSVATPAALARQSPNLNEWFPVIKYGTACVAIILFTVWVSVIGSRNPPPKTDEQKRWEAETMRQINAEIDEDMRREEQRKRKFEHDIEIHLQKLEGERKASIK